MAAAYVAPRARVASAPDRDWPGFATAFLDLYFEANPPSAVSAGRHEYDGRLPDWSPEAIRGEIARLERQREAALAFPESALTPGQRFERDHLVASVDGLLFWMKAAEWPFRNPTYYSGSLDPDVYVTREYAPLPERMRAYVRYALEVPRAARQVRANLRTPMPRTWVAVGRIAFGGLARYYAEDVPAVFVEVKDPALQRECWAHYTEEMMWEAGLVDGSPETHVGELLNALLRDARYLSAIGLHTGAMTVEESERLFRERAFQDAGTARQQAARGTFDPAYLNYTLGKLMILELREDWTATRGGRRAWKSFHDKVLGYGGPPIPLIRADMLGPQGGPPLTD